MLFVTVVFFGALVVAQHVKPAKLYARQDSQLGLTIETFCGAQPVLCGNGWCCYNGQVCGNDAGTQVCIDNSGTDLGSPPFTIDAAPYSSLLGDISSIASDLSQISQTLSAMPTTIEGGVSALPTHSISTSTTRTLPSDFTARDPPTETATPSNVADSLVYSCTGWLSALIRLAFGL